MRTLWSIVSFLAVVHLLALLMFVGWLWHSGRLNAERVEAVRQMFSQTIEAETAARAEAQREQQAALAQQAEAARAADPPHPSAQQVRLVSRLTEREEQSLRRLEEEKNLLLQELAATQERLARREAEFRAERKAWEQAHAAAIDRRTDEQFNKALRQLELVPAKQAKAMLEQLVAKGGTEQAVAYLDAMNPRAAAKILREFKDGDDSVLATELLERLRTFGTPAEGQPDAAHDDEPPAD